MTNEMNEHEMDCRISYLEDKLLRAKNSYEINNLRYDLGKLRSVRAKARIKTMKRGF